MPITIGFVPYSSSTAIKKSINNAPHQDPPPQSVKKILGPVLQAFPTVPTSVAIAALTGSGIRSTWSGAPTASSFLVTIYSSSSSLMTNPTKVTEVSVASSDETISFVPVNGLYYGTTIQAVNQNGRSLVTPLSSGSLYTAGPAAPTSVSLSALTGSGATVTWSGVSGATSYRVQIYYNSSSSVTTSNSQVTESPYTSATSGSTFTFTASPDLTYYAATVTAINAGGETTSLISGATRYYQIPGQPTVNTPTNTTTTLNMSWNAPVSGGSSITGYTVYVLADGSLAPSGTLTLGNVTSTTFSPMINGVAYSFYVVATGLGGAGTQSSTSSTVSYVVAPGAPTGISFSSFTASSAQISWTGGSGATSHNITIYSSASSNMASPTTVTSSNTVTSGSIFTFSLTVNRYFAAIVTAVNSGGSAASSMSTGVLYSPAPAGSYWIAVGWNTSQSPYLVYNTNSSPTGAWTVITSFSGVFSSAILTIAYNSVTGLFVAGGVGGFGYSYNLINWTSIPNIFTDVNYIVYANNKWVAVGSGTNTIAYSANGTSWTGLGKTIFTSKGFKVVYSPNSSPGWAAVGEGAGGSLVASSTSGSNGWTNVAGYSGYSLTGAASIAADTSSYTWIVVGNPAVTYMWNAATYFENSNSKYGNETNLVTAAYGNSTYVIATSAGKIYHTASSGFAFIAPPNQPQPTWTVYGGNALFTSNQIKSIEYNGSVFLAGCGSVQSGSIMAYATSPSTWTTVASSNVQSVLGIYGVYWKA